MTATRTIPNRGTAGARRRVVLIAIGVALSSVLVVEAVQAVTQIRDRSTGAYHVSTLETYSLLDCLSKRLGAVLPAHSKVYFDPQVGSLNGGLISQRLSELAFPRFFQVPTVHEAEFVLTAVVADRPGACSSVLVEIRPVDDFS